MVLFVAGPGCALVEDSCRNVIVGIKAPIEEQREKARNRQWAESAWREVACTANAGPHSEDYAQGFKDGFAEYLFRGGDGEPPLIAPLHYRDAKYQNEAGYHAIEDWFAGYRHGSTMARESGARKWIVGPSSLQAELDDLHPHVIPPPPGPPLPTPLPDAAKQKIESINLPPIPLLPAPQPVLEPKPAPIVEQKPKLNDAAAPAKMGVPTAAPVEGARIEWGKPADDGSAVPDVLREQIRRLNEAARKRPVLDVDVEPVPEAPIERVPPRVQKIMERPVESENPTPTPTPSGKADGPAPGPAIIGPPSPEPNRPGANAEPVPALPAAAPEPIRRINEAARPAPEANPEAPLLEPLPEPVRLRILKISEAQGAAAPKTPPAASADAPPAQPRITEIVATPQKD